MIPCDETDSLLMDYADDNLGAAEREKLEQHLESCAACRTAVTEYQELFALMDSHTLEAPSPMMEERFTDMLLAESEIASSQPAAGAVKTILIQSKTLPVWLRIAASIILLAGGVLLGRLTATTQTENGTQIAALNGEVREMKEALMMTLLTNESASERLKAVSYTESLTEPDGKVTDALLHTLNQDDNVNVRLAAAYSLDKLSSSQRVRDSLVASLPRQKEPVIQIVLINILAEHKEPKAIAPIRKILSDEKSLQPVKEIAAKGLQVM